ncbi:SufE family protein [Marichromatium gracile]|uniref:SufE family protein n=1 Tax=Marichromatium gracile TaxID=1048 RepID=UPI001F17FD37|nr:SufE family protein [Marichromatium gracile]MCF1183805.1 SufE family protein [Marichromatium gracile]
MHQDAAIQAIIDDFDLLDDWDQRYQYLVELGERLPAMDPADKTEDNRVVECMSLVHVVARPAEGGRLVYAGDCDTAIIKGVVALLVGLFSNRSAEEIVALDVDDLFTGLALDEHLSPNRHVGVFAIVNKMQRQAAALGA